MHFLYLPAHSGLSANAHPNALRATPPQGQQVQRLEETTGCSVFDIYRLSSNQMPSFMPSRRLIVASQSPRRHELLQMAGFDFEVRTRSIEEDFPADMPPHEVAEYLACAKSDAVQDWRDEDTVVLTADSVVIIDGAIYNKPADADEARDYLRRLSGKPHEVVTGVCLATASQVVAFSDRVTVYIAPITPAEMDYYLAVGHPYDKAGAYGIQEWIGFTKVERIEGAYPTVMGLPIHRVYAELIALGVPLRQPDSFLLTHR